MCLNHWRIMDSTIRKNNAGLKGRNRRGFAIGIEGAQIVLCPERNEGVPRNRNYLRLEKRSYSLGEGDTLCLRRIFPLLVPCHLDGFEDAFT